MEDRFTRGFAAGILAGIPPFIFNWAAFALNFSRLRWSDFMAVMTYGRRPEGPGEQIFSTMAVFFLLGLLGAIFAYLLPAISSRSYLLKAWVLAAFVWFASFTAAHLFQVPELDLIPLATVVTNFIGASIWGLALGLIFKWLDSRVKA